MQRWKLTIEYDGTDFSGWQRQEKSQISVQGTIEAALKAFTAQDITLHVAGRTDAGVHAQGQVAHFDLEGTKGKMTPFELIRAINANIGDHAVSVLKAEMVAPDFHARFDAVNKHYRYRILLRTAKPVREPNAFWHRHKKLDLPAMREGASHLLGKHDFTSFRASECQAKSPIRSLEKLDISEFDYDGCGGKEVRFDLEARSFLHHQVRNMVGTLVQVGEGKMPPERIREILEAKDRRLAGQTAPPTGLSLMRVDY